MIWQIGVRDSNLPKCTPPKNFPPLELPSTSFSIDTVCASCCYGHCAVDIANISIHSIANSHLLLKLDNKDIHLPFVWQRHSFLSIGDFNPSQSIPTRLPDTDHLTKRSSSRESWKKPWCQRSSIVMEIMIIMIIVHDHRWPLMIIKRQSLNATQRRRTLAITQCLVQHLNWVFSESVFWWICCPYWLQKSQFVVHIGCISITSLHLCPNTF